MYQKEHLVYIYYNDLMTSLLATKKLQYSRFGYITNISNYIQDNSIHNIYTVKTVSDSVFNIDQTQELKLCSYDELVSAVGTIRSQLSDKQYNDMLNLLNLHK